MKNNIKYFMWLVLLISYPVLGLITNQLSIKYNTNYNATGIIISSTYDSNLNVEPNIIKIYGYKNNEVITSNQQQVVKNSADILYENINILFVLIPRTYSYIESLTDDISNEQILSMNQYLDSNYISPTMIAYGALTEDQSLINQEIELLLLPLKNYLREHNIVNAFDAEKILQLSKGLVGSYGLFMPENINVLNTFNGYTRTLSSAVTVIDDLLITENDFNSSQQNITKDQFIQLQFLIFQTIEQAKTVIFIPECTAEKNTEGIRLPIALINKVSLNEQTGQITLDLLFCNKAINNFSGFHDFICARNSFLETHNFVDEWEVIYYTFELIDSATNDETNNVCSSNNLASLQYKFTSAQVKLDNCINHQENIQYYECANNNQQDVNKEHLLLDECRVPDETELSRINDQQENKTFSKKFLADLLFDNVINDNFIKTKFFEMLNNSNNIDTDAKQKEIIKDILKYKNGNFKFLCNHYNRKCLVQFNCGCNNYWACHRCHNEKIELTCCKSNKIQSYNLQKLKCLICNHEQYFNAKTFHSCIRCNTKFSDYHCGKCKHLSGIQKKPFHCNECNICRVHSDLAFHCDVCDICLPIRLKNNHKCRPNSAHDECIVCLEDTFLDFSAIPCNHRIHINCMSKMIRCGTTKCPICGEDFPSLKPKNDASIKVLQKHKIFLIH